MIVPCLLVSTGLVVGATLTMFCVILNTRQRNFKLHENHRCMRMCILHTALLTHAIMQYIQLLYVISCQNGVTSLMFASLNGHVEVVDKLLQHGARVDLQDEVGLLR